MQDQYLITGGAGFIGINVADCYLTREKWITILDNFSGTGTQPLPPNVALAVK